MLWNINDIEHVVEADRANVWHHRTQHKKLKPLTLWSSKGKACGFERAW